MRLTVLLLTAWLASLGLAHEGYCPFCKLPLVQNTKELDNEVVVKFGNKRIEYRCLSCVILDQARYKSDLVVYAPSLVPGEPVVLKRTEGKWIVPEGAVFLIAFSSHKECAALSRAFASRDALELYVKHTGAKDATALSFEEFVKQTIKPKAKEGGSQ